MFTDGFNKHEQMVLNMCLYNLDFTIPQIKNERIISALRLLKLIYMRLKSLYEDNDEKIPYISSIKQKDFLCPRIERIVKKHIQNPLQIIYHHVNPWIITLASHCPFILTEETRILLFRMTNFSRITSSDYLLNYLQ